MGSRIRPLWLCCLALLGAGCIDLNPDWLPLEESATTGGAGTESGAATVETSATGNVGSTGAPATSTGAATSTTAGQGSEDPSVSTSLEPEDLEPPNPSCVGPGLSVPLYVADYMFVVDKSYSMFNLSWQGQGGEQTHWASVYLGLKDLLAKLEGEAYSGLVLSPQLTPQANTWSVCMVSEQAPEVPLTENAYGPVMDAIPPMEPNAVLDYAFAGNPLGPAIARARSHLVQQDAYWSQFIIVITDGAPNCSPAEMNEDPLVGLTSADQDVAGIVNTARQEDDIFTFVIGVDVVPELPELLPQWEPGTNPVPYLTELAEFGGLGGPDDEIFINTKSFLDLEQSLSAVERFGSCILPIPDGLLEGLGVDSFKDVMLNVAGVEYFGVDDCVVEDGYVIIDGFKHDFIALCNAACDDGFQNPDSVEAYACEP